jgi:hypothetical protein
MSRLILTLTFVCAAALLVSAPATASAQYGFYGNYSGGGHNYQPHVRSFLPNGAALYPAVQPYGGFPNAWGPAGGYGPYQSYGYAPLGNGPYGYGYGNGFQQGYSNGRCYPRW